MSGIRAHILIALATALAAMAAGSAPARGAPVEFIGIAAFEDPSAEEFELMGDAGVGTYRTNFHWPAVEPLAPGTRDWSRYDALIGDAARAGIRVLPTIYGSPSWAAEEPQHPPDSEHRADFGRFLAAAVKRYGPGGSFWEAQLDLPALPVRAWQIWNEPNVPLFWLPNPTAAEYALLLAAAEGAIHGVDPSVQVVLGGLFPTRYGNTGVAGPRFLTDLYEAGAAPLFDAVAVHPYAGNPATALRLVGRTRELIDSQGDAGTPIWITEIGWATSGTRSAVTVSEEVQAEYVREVFELASEERKRLRIAGVIWFSFQDQEAELWPNRTGLLTVDGEEKPALEALEEVASEQVPISVLALVGAARRLSEGIVGAARRLAG